MAKRTYNGAVFFPGDRVQLAPHLSAWMQGDRFGNVQRTTKGGATVHVLMDVSNKVRKIHASCLSPINISAISAHATGPVARSDEDINAGYSGRK